MITIDNINSIFNRYNTLSADADVCTDRNLHELMMFAIDSPFVDFNGDCLTFANAAAPLDSIEIERIAGAHDFGSHWAIVMPTSVIFVNKKSGDVKVHLAA